MRIRRRAFLLASAAAACGSSAITLRGAGATLPALQYARWLSRYAEEVDHVRIDYLPIGSGGGIRQLAEGTVDFGATDVELDAEEERLFAAPLLLVPTARVAVVVAHSLPIEGLALTPDLLVRIYLGEIVRWNDPAIAAQNPGAALPDLGVVPVFRSDGGGTNALFSRYLARMDEAARARIGSGRSARFQAGIGARGSDGVVALVARTPGAIGYVELVHAQNARLHAAALRAADGSGFVLPDGAALSDAQAGYPLVSPTYLVFPRDFADLEKGAAMARFSYWILTRGQETLASGAGSDRLLPLRDEDAREARASLGRMTSGRVRLLAID